MPCLGGGAKTMPFRHGVFSNRRLRKIRDLQSTRSGRFRHGPEGKMLRYSDLMLAPGWNLLEEFTRKLPETDPLPRNSNCTTTNRGHPLANLVGNENSRTLV
jgi:hypothetical protein